MQGRRGQPFESVRDPDPWSNPSLFKSQPSQAAITQKQQSPIQQQNQFFSNQFTSLNEREIIEMQRMYQSEIEKLKNQLEKKQDELDNVKAQNVVYQDELASKDVYSNKLKNQVKQLGEYINNHLDPTIEQVSCCQMEYRKKRLVELENSALKKEKIQLQKQLQALLQQRSNSHYQESVGNITYSSGGGQYPNQYNPPVHSQQNPPVVRPLQTHHQYHDQGSGQHANYPGAPTSFHSPQAPPAHAHGNYGQGGQQQPIMYNQAYQMQHQHSQMGPPISQPPVSQQQQPYRPHINQSMHVPYNPMLVAQSMKSTAAMSVNSASNGISHQQSKSDSRGVVMMDLQTSIANSPRFSNAEEPSFRIQPKNDHQLKGDIQYDTFVEGIDAQFGFEMSIEKRNGPVQDSKYDTMMEGSSVFEKTDPKLDEDRRQAYANLSL